MKEKYTDLMPKDVDYILIKNTDTGPFLEDIFYLIISKDQIWEIPHTGDTQFLDWLKTFPDVNMEQFMKSMACAENKVFILYRGIDFPVLSEGMREILKERFSCFLESQFQVSLRDRERLMKDLFLQYAEDHRSYHNLEHILNCLWELDQLPDGEANKETLELAIWYHDYIYKPQGTKNECESAERMLEGLKDYAPMIFLNEVKSIIISDPNANDLSCNQKIFLDIDHSILGQREIEYMVYRQNIVLEFNSVPHLWFKMKRKAFLKRVVERGGFLTEIFRTKYQEIALRNIEGELAHWTYKFLPPYSF